MFAETVFDVISLVGSIGEVCANPYDVGAWINAGAELVDVAVPFVTGVGEAVRGVRAAAKMAEAADNVGDAVKVADKASTDASRNNIVIALPHGVHVDVNRAQYALNARNQNPLENINANAFILYNHDQIPNSQVNMVWEQALQHYTNIKK